MPNYVTSGTFMIIAELFRPTERKQSRNVLMKTVTRPKYSEKCKFWKREKSASRHGRSPSIKKSLFKSVHEWSYARSAQTYRQIHTLIHYIHRKTDIIRRFRCSLSKLELASLTLIMHRYMTYTDSQNNGILCQWGIELAVDRLFGQHGCFRKLRSPVHLQPRQCTRLGHTCDKKCAVMPKVSKRTYVCWSCSFRGSKTGQKTYNPGIVRHCSFGVPQGYPS